MVNSYTYDPFGNLFTAETAENTENPFKFTGQWYDKEIGQYYLRARQYDPHLMRFTTRDPVRGDLQEPMSLHPYLYCSNDPANRTDPSGELWGAVARARGLVGAINIYGLLLNMSVSGSRSPCQIIDSLTGINTFREYTFTGFYSKGHAQAFAKAGYFDWNDPNPIVRLLTPGDEMKYKEYEGKGKTSEGFYRHCVASCRLNRFLISLFGPSIFPPMITYAAGLTFGGDWSVDPADASSRYDPLANRVGIRISYLGYPCNIGCRDALFDYSSKNP
ncbi:MAG: RHS repeat-associated core domain-containing protein [Phycisphaerae bacterium]